MAFSEAGQEYRVAKRSVIANRSVALDNLYHVLSERVPQSDLTLRIPGQAIVSPQALKQYMATRRTNDATWYADMQKAAPATVDREQLFVLAEIEKLLFQLHQDNQRVISTLSMMQLQNVQQAKRLLRVKERKAASVIGVKLTGEPDTEAAMKAAGIEVPKAKTEEE